MNGGMNTPEPTSSEPLGDAESWRSYVPEPVAQPPSIRTAVRLMYLGAVLSALGTIGSLFERDETREALADSDSSLSADEVDTQTDALIGLGVVVGVVAIGLWIWMAITNGKGKAWARIVATVLGALSIVRSLLSLAISPATALGLVLVLIGLALAIVILVLLYRPDSNRYYDAMSPS